MDDNYADIGKVVELVNAVSSDALLKLPDDQCVEILVNLSGIRQSLELLLKEITYKEKMVQSRLRKV